MNSRHGFVSRIAGFSPVTALGLAMTLHAAAAGSGSPLSSTNSQLVQASNSQPIPWSELGAKATAQYNGDGLAVFTGENGVVRLRCVFQKLDGEVTREGLWLTSTTDGSNRERFRVLATGVGREPVFGVRRQSEATPPLLPGEELVVAPESGVGIGTESHDGPLRDQLRFPPHSITLPPSGIVAVREKVARFARPGLVEDYTVSMDGVRQDFVVMKKPTGAGELQVQLEVTGARVEQAISGARLVLENSGRKITYGRLRVTDATGRELTARMEVPGKTEIRNPKSEISLAVLVNDANAVYPVRIDPTFSDADWIVMNPRIPGTDGPVYDAVTDGSGNLYIGGNFTVVGDVFANHIAKWNGNSWTALGSGMNGPVHALAVSGNELYAGGWFGMAGGNWIESIAKWNGSSWSALGSGIERTDGFHSTVYALAASGSDLYAGGDFTTADGSAANRIAKWNGSSWSALASGMDSLVFALAVSGSDVYVGGALHDRGWQSGQAHCQMEREQLVAVGFRGGFRGYRRQPGGAYAGGVRWRLVCGGLFYHGGWEGVGVCGEGGCWCVTGDTTHHRSQPPSSLRAERQAVARP